MSMSYLDYEDKYGETRGDLAERPQCPICGSYNVKHSRYLDGQDADGNRGQWIEEYECEDCEGEEDEPAE